MKTVVYIDGFNLYYGCLKHTPHKWLDLVKLFERILNEQCEQTDSLHIKFFTADVKANVATNGDKAQISQQNYHRGLLQLYPSQLTIISGYYSLDKAHLPAFQRPIDKTKKVEVWRLEEKQTDVNIAMHAYRDAAKGNADRLVFVSNDTDLEPVLMAIREDFGNNHDIGVIIPTQKPRQTVRKRPINQRLSQHANWTRRYISEECLEACQLPGLIPTRKKPIIKPDYW
jgi:uncharacterized LabA/DUF88 family protein